MLLPQFPYRRRISLSAATAAALHVIVLLALAWINSTPDETGFFGGTGGEGGLAPLPSIAEQSGGEAGPAGPRRAPPAHGSAATPSHSATSSSPAVSTNITPVAPSEIVGAAPLDTSTQRARTGSARGVAHGAFDANQDTMYARGLRTHIAAGTRFKGDLAWTDSAWQDERARRANSVEETMKRNLAFTPSEIAPTERQKINRSRELSPGVPNDIMPNIPRAGISINFSTRSLLGLDEDVSATFSYTLRHTSHVTVTVYGVHGDTVSKMFDGLQQAGKHTMTWTGTDDKGAYAPAGDYVVEIVIDNERRITKRIVVS